MNSSSSSTSKMLRLKNGCDRLSELPDNVLLHILSFMPIVDAVRTVVIRRFGSLWTHLPSLKFDDSHIPWVDGESNEEDFTLGFANFVRNVLFLHKRVPIHSFNLCFGHDLALNDPTLNKCFDQEFLAWIRFAIDRQVKNLHLDIGFNLDTGCDLSLPGSVPQCVFTSQFLVELKLYNFQINELRSIQMRSLTKLSLGNVAASNEVLNKIILGCPSLREMELLDVTGLDELCFTAPNIEKLTLDDYDGLLDCPNLKFLDVNSIKTVTQLVDVSSVREVSIRHCGKPVFEECLKKFSNAEVFRCFGVRLPYSMQGYSQTRWKCLHTNSELHGDQLLAICRVLRSSPLVEELIVDIGFQHMGRTCDQSMLSIELPSCLLQQLKTVTVRGYETPCHGLLRLAEFLLKSSVSLEKFVILPSKYPSKRVNELKFVKQLLSFPRASSNARVIFGEERK